MLRACSEQKDLSAGSRIHAEIVKNGLLEDDAFVGSSLVSMYAKCGSLEMAQEVFDKLPARDVVSWSALIAGYAQHGCGEEALNCFQQMQDEGMPPNTVTFVCILKACGQMGAADKGGEIHAEIARKGLQGRHVFIGNALVDMYLKCGSLAKAQEVFDKLLVRDVVSWNVLIAGFANHECGEEALHYFGQMHVEGVLPNSVTLVCILKALGSFGVMMKGQEVHAMIAIEGLLDKDRAVGATLVDMYAKWGKFERAKEVFDKLPDRNVVAWNTLIAGFVQHGCGEKALSCFQEMQLDGVCPDAVTYLCVLKACGSLRAVDKGGELHVDLARNGLLEKSNIIGTALVDMYAKCGLLVKAQKLFDQLPVRDVVAWNSLIAGFAEHGQGESALHYFDQMQLQGVSANAVTFVCALRACANIKALDKGLELHSQITRKGLSETGLVASALIDMYVKCGILGKARDMFWKINVREVALWNALITGYVQHGHSDEALDIFQQMQLEGVSPDAITFVCILKACGNTGSASHGQQIHAEIARKGLLERDVVVGTALVYMHCTCGLLFKAQEAFNKLAVRNTASWNTLIAGYAFFGMAEHVFHIFGKMIGECIELDLITFVSVLNACSHTGLVDRGELCFENMSKDYGIWPVAEHYSCMIDLFGRAGQLDKVVSLIKRMPFQANLSVWHIVLGACLKWGNMELGRWAFQSALQLDTKDPAVYVSLSNIYSDLGAVRVVKEKPRCG